MDYECGDPWLTEALEISWGLDDEVFDVAGCVELPDELDAHAGAADDDPEFEAEFDEWFTWLQEKDLLLPVEQSCDSQGLLLDWDMRAVRLRTLPGPLLSLLHFFFRKCPVHVRALLAQQVFWLVRFERIHRCGTPVWKPEEGASTEDEVRAFYRPNRITYRNYAR